MIMKELLINTYWMLWRFFREKYTIYHYIGVVWMLMPWIMGIWFHTGAVIAMIVWAVFGVVFIIGDFFWRITR